MVYATFFLGYKAYLSSCLSFNNDTKKSSLPARGWVNDRADYFDHFKANYGWVERRQFFGEADNKDNLSSREVTFITQLVHDLNGCSQGLVPGYDVSIIFVTVNKSTVRKSRKSQSKKNSMQFTQPNHIYSRGIFRLVNTLTLTIWWFLYCLD